MPPQEWGVMTQKNGTLYVHLMDPGAPDELVLPGLSDKAISSATRLDSGEAVPFIQGPDLKINVPASGRDAIDTILVLSVKESG
jgi:hypothetical protein